MFERTILTQSGGTQKGRAAYFLSSSAALAISLVTALVISLFSVELKLTSTGLALVELLPPVRQPAVEPEPPALPEPLRTSSGRTSTAKTPTRQVNMARLDETPPSVPEKISTVQNTQRARPSDRYFKIGRFDTDPIGDQTAVRGDTGISGSASAGGLQGHNATVASIEPEEVPPPPVKPRPIAKALQPINKVPPVQSMGVINGKATSLPKPIYPAAAKAVHAQGTVNVKVMIDESGHVVSADAISGHPLLRHAAETAARGARFTPTLLSGTAVRISGTIVYNFSI
jgi:TonB family protein